MPPDPTRSLEVVTVRVRARGGARRLPRLPRLRGAPTATRARPVWRRVFLDGHPCRTGVYERDELRVGWRGRGPVIICEYSATTVVPPGWRVRVDREGGLMLETGRG